MPRDDNDVTLPGEASVTTESATEKPEAAENKAKRLRDEKLLALARKQFRTCASAEQFYRTQAIEDTKFRAGTWGEKSFQWDPGVEAERRDANRPCLTINRAPTFIRQVTNQARGANLVIKVSPVDDKGDPKLAEVFQGLIRNTERISFADRAYNAGSEKQAEQGRGFIKIDTEYATDKGSGPDLFRQRPRLKRVSNPLSIYVDPAVREADYSDADFSFEVTDLDEAVFEDVMGEPPPAASTLETFSADGDQTGDWFPNGKIRVAMWFHKESTGEKRHLALLSNGTVITYPDDKQMVILKALGDSVLQHRWVDRKQVVKRKITALKIYDESIWPADAQPYIPVLGDELEVDGEKDFRGVLRDSKASGKVYNVEVSALVEQVGLGIKAPLVGYKGQFGAVGSTQRKAWETAHLKPHPFLEVDPMDIDGKPAPLPQRNIFELPLQGTVLAIRQTDEDYKTTAGFHDASLGQRGPQESGKAIALRKDQDELGSGHYLGNLKFALSAVGRQLIQIYRVLYDVPTIVRIVGNDNKPKKFMVYSGAKNDPRQPQFLQNDPTTGTPVPFALPDGVDGIFDLTAGEFDVEVSAAPDHGTRRQEAVEAMTALFHGLPPEIAAKFLDLYFLVMDFPMAQQMSERAKKLLPPELQDQPEGAPPPIPPEMHAKIQQLEQAFGMAQKVIETKQLELQNRLDLQHMKNVGDLSKTHADNETRLAVAELGAKVDRLNLFFEERARLGLQAHEAGLTAMEHVNRTAEADQAHGQAIIEAQQGNDHAIALKGASAPPPPAAPTGGGPDAGTDGTTG